MTAFYRRWVFANGWSECLGLGTTFIIGGLLAPWLAGLNTISGAIGGAFAGIVLGIALEGALVGLAQERALRQSLHRLPCRVWVRATAIGAGLAWTLGMIPSTLMALMATTPAGEVVEPSAIVKYGLAAAMGAATGPVLGVAQWTVLRRHAGHAHRWLWANALAWSAGMPLVFLGMDLVPWQGPTVLIWTAIYLICGTVGILVGAIHGMVLRGLLQELLPTVDEVRPAVSFGSPCR